LDEKRRQLLSRRINDLRLTIQGTRLEPLIAHVYQELENAGISFRPGTYLSDEWGCPNRTPVIGIPFYLADPVLCALEDDMTGIEAETDAEVIMYLRHEVGHAFNYAYRLYRKKSWRATFGLFSRPYEEEYRPRPFSMRFVRHAPGWYAQKHPDDDFAETFGVWLDPASDWRKMYAGTAAIAKLQYVNKAAALYGKAPPAVNARRLDTPVEDMTMTLDSWYEKCREVSSRRPGLTRALDIDVCRLFAAGKGRPALEFLLANRRTLVRDVNNWTGVDRHLVAGVVDELIERAAALGLKTPDPPRPVELARASVFVAALAMNYLWHGEFVPE
jgi:hypothetical protein